MMEQEKRLAEKRKVMKILEEGQDLINELADEAGGGQLVKEIITLYIERINYLIQNDPECQVFERLFGTIKRKINAGKKIVEGKTKGIIG